LECALFHLFFGLYVSPSLIPSLNIDVDTDLYKLIMSPQYLTTAHIRTFLYQMLKGLKHLHSSSVIHRDLKPANILLNEDCSLKICDFGLARIVDSSQVAKSNDDGSSSDSSNPRNPEKKVCWSFVCLTAIYCDANLNFTFYPPNQKQQQGLTRQLTKHVVTRWYRAPELILIQPYTTAVDIWSVGCIFAELLSMQEGSVPSYEDRVPLFPGGSCFPLSGDSDSKTSERLDQLSVIFGVIGSPSNEDVESIGNANQYIKTLKKSPSKSVESMYPAADAQAIDLLKKMLQFNPSTRCTADEALSHAFLEDVRQVEMEKNADGPLVGPDFLNSDMISIEEIKKRILEEVSWFKEQDAN
jgi:mitogen-activated protein kinase 1/3